jgi:NAD(P)-dependent dehydrogenase (short-subunit alcohol dehydrogenase family)
MNHLALTLKAEEPDITTIAIRPGVVDTEMQRELREVHHDRMDKKDKEKFMSAKANGTCKWIQFRSCWLFLRQFWAFSGSGPGQ